MDRRSPKEHLAYVDECNEKPHKGDAKDLARLMKAWKYFCNVPVSSFYLEMRAAQHVAAQSTYIHVWDVCQLLESLQENKLAGMNDPKGATGRICACSTDAKREGSVVQTDDGCGESQKEALDRKPRRAI